MTIVNSWNEWDQLKHVIVGVAENSNIPPMKHFCLNKDLLFNSIYIFI